MKFTIVTIGSRGDVQPFLALGKGLQDRGHRVRICAMHVFQDVIEEEGFEYAPMAGDAREVMRRLIGEQVSSFEYFSNLKYLLNPVKEEFLSNIETACTGADAILYSLLGSVAYHVGEKLKIPCFRVPFCPVDPTGEFPAMTAPLLPLGRAYNRLTFWGGDLLWSNATRSLLNDWRSEMGLRKIRLFEFPYRRMNGETIPTLYPFSPVLVPKPKEWSKDCYLTGFWIRESTENWAPDEKLANFLSNGTKPIYIGFGSTVGGDFDRILHIVLESIANTGQRALLSSGWRSLKGVKLSDNVMQIGNIPHEWLFKRMAAVSHHGGAGTTAAGVRAGVPSVIVPFGGDQPFWGIRLFELGIGTKPIWTKELTVENYSNAIMEAVGNHRMKEKAAQIGERLRAENGVHTAVEIIEKILADK